MPHADRPHLPGYGIVPEQEGAGLLPWSWAVERLEASRHVWVSTVSGDGTPHLAAVWAVWLDWALHFSSSGRSRKARNLARRPACSVATEDPLESLVLSGVARRHDHPDAIDRVGRAYEAKYGGGFPDPAENPLFAVAPRVAIAVIGREDEFTTTATRWTFDDRPSR